MTLLILKLFTAVFTWLSALIGGGLPFFFEKDARTSVFLSYGEVFARGIFLGTGLIHLLPDAHEHFSKVVHGDYPYIFVLCAFTIALLIMVEQGIRMSVDKKKPPLTWKPYLLLIILSVHSLIAGAALGIESLASRFFVLFIAIVAHKAAAAFALCVHMKRHKVNAKSMRNLLLVFSVMTPIGILFGSGVNQLLQTNTSLLAQGLFDTLAAGTFIYIATFNPEHTEPCPEHPKKLSQIVFFILGLALMAGVTI